MDPIDRLYLVGFKEARAAAVASALARLLGWGVIPAGTANATPRRRNVAIWTAEDAFACEADRKVMLKDGAVIWLYVEVADERRRTHDYSAAHMTVGATGSAEEVAARIVGVWPELLRRLPK